jgi:hypothetical protein
MAALKVSTAIGKVFPTVPQSACAWNIWLLPLNEIHCIDFCQCEFKYILLVCKLTFPDRFAAMGVYQFALVNELNLVNYWSDN